MEKIIMKDSYAKITYWDSLEDIGSVETYLIPSITASGFKEYIDSGLFKSDSEFGRVVGSVDGKRNADIIKIIGTKIIYDFDERETNF